MELTVKIVERGLDLFREVETNLSEQIWALFR